MSTKNSKQLAWYHQRHKAYELHAQGMKQTNIARILGVPLSTMSTWLHRTYTTVKCQCVRFNSSWISFDGKPQKGLPRNIPFMYTMQV